MNSIAQARAASQEMTFQLDGTERLGNVAAVLLLLAGVITALGGLFASSILLAFVGFLIEIAGSVLFSWMVAHNEENQIQIF